MKIRDRRAWAHGRHPLRRLYYKRDVWADPEIFDHVWSGRLPAGAVFATDAFTYKWGKTGHPALPLGGTAARNRTHPKSSPMSRKRPHSRAALENLLALAQFAALAPACRPRAARKCAARRFVRAFASSSVSGETPCLLRPPREP